MVRSYASKVAVGLGLVALAVGSNLEVVSTTVTGGTAGEFAAAVAVDAAGNVYLAGQTSSPDFISAPNGFQTHFGGESDAWIMKLDPAGSVVYATYLGGSRGDGVRGLAVDAEGTVYVAGITTSPDFPLARPLQARLDNGSVRQGVDAFVAKLDPSGARLEYSTYFGGSELDHATAIAVDRAGAAYVVGYTDSSRLPGLTAFEPSQRLGGFIVKIAPEGDRVVYARYAGFPHGVAVDAEGAAYLAGSTGQEASVVKLNPAGDAEVYTRRLAGFSEALAIAVDAAGHAYVAGRTRTTRFPLVNAVQNSIRALPFWRSTDGGESWEAFDDSALGNGLHTLVAAPTSPSTVYAATDDEGVFRSSDGGRTWEAASDGLESLRLLTLAVDPFDPSTLYAGTADRGVYKTSDAARTWTPVNNGLAIQTVAYLLASPAAPGRLYAGSRERLLFLTDDGGGSWNRVQPELGVPLFDTALALDPWNPATLYGGLATRISLFGLTPPPALYRTADGGRTWQPARGVIGSVSALAVARTTPPTIYSSSFRSPDGGETWLPFENRYFLGFALDPSNPFAAYAISNRRPSEILRTSDAGGSWTTLAPVPAGNTVIRFLAVDPQQPSTLYAAVATSHSTAFVAKLTPDGSDLVYSTFLGGRGVQEDYSTGLYFAGGTNIAWGVAVDASGNAYVTGATASDGFPAWRAIQSTRNGMADAFLAKFSPGGALLASTYLGGAAADGARAVALGPGGEIYIAGQTNSEDFPGAAASNRGYGDAFLARVRLQE